MFATRRPRVGTVIGGIAAGLAAIVTSLVIVTDRADQKSTFSDDVQFLGHRIVAPVSWDDESNGILADSTLEIGVKVAGCDVELERSDSTTDTSIVRGHPIRHFRIDQAGIVEDIKKSPFGALTPTDVERFLRSNYPNLGCLRKK